MTTPAQLESLKQALASDGLQPYCIGAITPSPEGLFLYYGKRNPSFINFANVTTEELDRLAAACHPATAGRAHGDAYDESHRKAVKMNPSDFSAQFDLVGSGLMKIVQDQLLQAETENTYLRAEVRELNVYGKDSFFKAHKDKPRGKDMLGSLVVVYPTAHEGGEFVLRHEDEERKLDIKCLRHSASLAFVAFYNDIEREVLKVTSGYRVAVTYNLYLVNPAFDLRAAAAAPKVRSISRLRTALHGLLERPEFMPNGGTLGFGLVHTYPVAFDMNLPSITDYLKGEDAHVYRTCQELQLGPSLLMVYDDNTVDRLKYGIMLDRIIHDPDYDYDCGAYEDTLMEMGGVPVNKTEDVTVDDRIRNELEHINWISPFNDTNQLRDACTARGNEVSQGSIYCSPCIIVCIAPASSRL